MTNIAADTENLFVLDLSNLTKDGRVTNLASRPHGKNVRLDNKLADKEEIYDHINVILPKNIKAISPSFFLGLFGGSVKKTGNAEKFFKKFHFDVPYKKDEELYKLVHEQIKDGVKDVFVKRGQFY